MNKKEKRVAFFLQAVEKVFSTACFYVLNLFYVSTLIKKRKRRISYDGCFKNHRDERVSVSVEELVPQDHFLRAIEATISFDFIEEKLRPYYCENNGRPSIHPIVLFKMMFIGYFTAFVLSVNWKRRLKRILPTVGFRVFSIGYYSGSFYNQLESSYSFYSYKYFRRNF